MLSVEPGEAVKTPGKWGEDMAGEVADLEFFFLATQGPHHPGNSLFPGGPPSPSYPLRQRELGERPCLVMAMGGGG